MLESLRILLFRVLYSGPLFSETPASLVEMEETTPRQNLALNLEG